MHDRDNRSESHVIPQIFVITLERAVEIKPLNVGCIKISLCKLVDISSNILLSLDIIRVGTIQKDSFPYFERGCLRRELRRFGTGD